MPAEDAATTAENWARDGDRKKASPDDASIVWLIQNPAASDQAAPADTARRWEPPVGYVPNRARREASGPSAASKAAPGPAPEASP